MTSKEQNFDRMVDVLYAIGSTETDLQELCIQIKFKKDRENLLERHVEALLILEAEFKKLASEIILTVKEA